MPIPAESAPSPGMDRAYSGGPGTERVSSRPGGRGIPKPAVASRRIASAHRLAQFSERSEERRQCCPARRKFRSAAGAAQLADSARPSPPSEHPAPLLEDPTAEGSEPDG